MQDWLKKITEKQIIQTPSISVRREVYETIGAFDTRLSWCEDWEMWARIASQYKIGYVNEILAEYRIHTSSNSSRYIVSGENLKDLQRGVEIISKYVNYMPTCKYIKEALDKWALYGLNMSVNIIDNREGSINQLKEALKMAQKEDTYLRAAVVFDKIKHWHKIGTFSLLKMINPWMLVPIPFLRQIILQPYKTKS